MVKLIIEKGGSTYEYVFTNIDSVSFGKESPTTEFSIVEQETPELVKLEGVLYTISISWKIKNETTDLSNGTNATEVKTIHEQLEYLFSKFIQATVGDQTYVVFNEWPIWNTQSNTIWKGIVRKVSIRCAGGNPNFFEATLDFAIGENVLKG